MSSFTQSPHPGTVAEEEKEREEDSQGKQKGRKRGCHRKKPRGRRELGEQKTTLSDKQAPEREMRFPQLKGGADINHKDCSGAWEASSPTHSFYLRESKAQRGHRSSSRTHSKSGLNPNQSHRIGAPGQKTFLDFLLSKERGLHRVLPLCQNSHQSSRSQWSGIRGRRRLIQARTHCTQPCLLVT